MAYEAAKDPELAAALREFAEAYGYHEAMAAGKIRGRTNPSLRERQAIVTRLVRARSAVHAYIDWVANTS